MRIYVYMHPYIYSARFSQCMIGLTKPRTSEEEEECVRDVTGVPNAAPPHRGRGCVQAGRSLPTDVQLQRISYTVARFS